jgi:hypothetical protein
MDTLMRTLKRLAVGVLFVMGTVLPVHAQAPDAPAQPAAPPQEQPAQTPPAQTPPAQPTPVQPTLDDDDDDAVSRFFFAVNMGGQNKEQSFSDDSTFSIYNETGATATAHTFGGGTLFDISAGVNVWKGLGVGIAYTTITNVNDALVSVRVPHPVIFGQSRTATAVAEDLEHSENAVHLQFMWTVPLTRKFLLTVSAGPSFFTVRQTVASVQAPEDILDPPPFNNLSIKTVTLTDVKDSPVGVNVGLDGTYVITEIKGIGIGVGGFVRYTNATLDLPTDATGDAELTAGGPQGGVGLRLRF